MKDVAVSSYFLPIISAERELIGNNKLFLIFSYLSRKARTYIGENKEKRMAGSASSIFAAASCTLSYRQQTALHLVSMILVQRSFWTCFRISLTLPVVNLGRPFTEEKRKSPVPFWGKLPFRIFRKSSRKE